MVLFLKANPTSNPTTTHSSSHPPRILRKSLAAHIPLGWRQWAQTVFFSCEKQQTAPPFSCFLRLIDMENEGHAMLYVPVGKPQQVTRSHSNTASLMHAVTVETAEYCLIRSTKRIYKQTPPKTGLLIRGGQVQSMQMCTHWVKAKEFRHIYKLAIHSGNSLHA